MLDPEPELEPPEVLSEEPVELSLLLLEFFFLELLEGLPESEPVDISELEPDEVLVSVELAPDVPELDEPELPLGDVELPVLVLG